MNTLSWSSPTTPLPTENNPRVVFERLFGDGGTSAQRLAQARENRSILDSVTERAGAGCCSTLGPADRATVDDYVDLGARGRAADSGASRRHGATTVLPTLDRPMGHSGALRRSRQADVRPAVAGVSGRHHPRHDVHARARAQLPHLSRNRHHRGAPRAVAPRRQSQNSWPSTRS